MRTNVWSVLLVGGAIGACGTPAVSPEPSVPVATATSPATAAVVTPPEDARIAGARADARAGREADAAVALRALVNDAALDADLRATARLALVEIWLDHEEHASDAAACVAPPDSVPPGASHTARAVGVPPALGARSAARAELRCLDASGRDTSAARARIDAIVQRETSACALRGDVPAEGHLMLLGSGSADPCADASGSVVGLSALDQRLGVAPPPSPFADMVLGGVQ